jgi:hypothetical protein
MDTTLKYVKSVKKNQKNLRVGLISCLNAKCSGKGSTAPETTGFLSILGDCTVFNGEDLCGEAAEKNKVKINFVLQATVEDIHAVGKKND